MRLTLNVIVDWLSDGELVFVVPELALIIVVIISLSMPFPQAAPPVQAKSR